MNIADFDYELPPELIAQKPAEPRDSSRLMVLNRAGHSIEHCRFHEVADYIQSGNVLVFNDSRVIPARLLGQKSDNGTAVEILLLRRLEEGVWETLVRPGKKIRSGTDIIVSGKSDSRRGDLTARVIGQHEGGIRVVRFSDESVLEQSGQVPLPPYIHEPLADTERYQTVYSRVKGSVAAPTAGLHFTPTLIGKLQQKEVETVFVTLHIGLDTFRPVQVDEPHLHPIHKEYGILSQEAADVLNRAREEGRKVIAVGTSTVRLIEAASRSGVVEPLAGWIDLFILPGYRFRAADALITNFHLPRSTLLMLVAAFAGGDSILHAYKLAISLGYRFYSFGDAMLVL